MLSHSSKKESTNLIKTIFVSGISEEDITNFFLKKNHNIFPEIFFCYPIDRFEFSPNILEYIYHDGKYIEYQDLPPRYFATVFTNEKGVRTYYYTIKLYEKIILNKKSYFFPYSITIWSEINDSISFKSILTEFYRIIRQRILNIDHNILKSYYYLEFVNLIIFLNSIIIPPSNSILYLNLHYSKINMEFQSLCKIPNNEEFITLLFNLLDNQTIIKLWCSILLEKHIILISNQAYLLFSITQALLSLIFPFHWLHTYIPILPKNQQEYLDCPTPYIIGVISEDYNELNEKYEGHVICDINSSTINKNGISMLSFIEEDKIKKKLMYYNNPKIFEIEDIYINKSDKKLYNKKNFDIEDINLNAPLGVNVHNIFFKIFKFQLNAIQLNYQKDQIFNVQTFLENYCQDDMKDFWEKLTETSAFNFFLTNLNNLDDLNMTIFKNIINLEEKEENQIKEKLRIEYFLPNDIDHVLEQFKEYEENKDECYKILHNLKIDYSFCYNQLNNNENIIDKKCQSFINKIPINKNKIPFKKSNSESKKANKEKIYFSRKSLKLDSRKSFVMYFQDYLYNDIFCIYSKRFLNKLQSKLDNNQIKTSLKLRKKLSLMNINYKINYSDNFTNFCEFFFVTLTPKNNLIFGYKDLIFSQIKHIFKSKKSVFLGSNGSYQFQEKYSEDSKKSFEINDLKDESLSVNNSSSYSLKDKESIKNAEEIDLLKIDMNQDYIMKYNATNISQFYLYSAYVLETNVQNINKYKYLIFSLYKKSYKLNRYEFNYNKFYLFLNNFLENELESISNNLLENKSYKYNYKLLQLIKMKIDKLNPKRKSVHKKHLKLPLNNFDFHKTSSLNGKSSKTQIKINKSIKKHKTITINKGNTNINSTLALFFSYKIDNQEYDNIINNDDKDEKDENKPVKINILNLYKKFKETNRDPILLIEKISIDLYMFLLKNSINKINNDIININYLSKLNKKNEFKEIKELVAELQVANLKYILKLENKYQIAFWLNTFNFLLIFSIIYKKDVLITNYEWYKFKKNAYFNIGGYILSLFEIENILLKNNYISKKIYGEISDFPKGDLRNRFIVNDRIKFLNFAISEPMKTCNKLQIYFPQSLEKQIFKNTIDFFSKYIFIESKNYIIKIPEYLSWLEEEFINNLPYYKDVINYDIFNYINGNKGKIEIVKNNWPLNFENI